MEQQKITLEQALSVLDQAASAASLPRQGHVLVQQAIQVLSKFIAEHTEKE